MITNEIQKISSEFITEAKHSPNLLSDMAAMEMYLAESYGERILIELLQNADDASSKNIFLLTDGDTVYFANDGHPFTGDDITSICRSGSSKKVRGKEIGFRGVGFKSTTALSTDILISSGDAVFSFSKRTCAEVLGTSLSKVPTVRIPFLIDEKNIESDIAMKIKEIHADGFSTIFVFKNSKISIIEQEIQSFDTNYLLFLRNIGKVEISSGQKIVYSINREFDQFGQIAELSQSRQTSIWWMPMLNGRNSIAFKLNDKRQIIPCNPDEAVFHCYLPTLEAAPYKFKINGDFTTDPSRKHLTNDSKTREILKIISGDLLETIQKIIDGSLPYSEMLHLLTVRISYSAISSLFADQFVKTLPGFIQILLGSGEIISMKQYLLLESVFNENEKIYIRKNCFHFSQSSAQENDPNIELFFTFFLKDTYPLSEYLFLLSERNFVKECPPELFGKIFDFIIKKNRISSELKNQSLREYYLKLTADQEILISDITPITKFSNEIVTCMEKFVSDGDWKWFCKNNNIINSIVEDKKNDDTVNNTVPSVITEKSHKTYVSRWRSAEQQCMDIEKSMGNEAKYVGNQNLGYDVESTTKDGEKRYIEVKLIPSGSASFTMTNNEYSSANQLGDKYFMCIINQSETGIKATLISNPVEMLFLEKRVKVWEWYCASFEGDVHEFLYEK